MDVYSHLQDEKKLKLHKAILLYGESDATDSAAMATIHELGAQHNDTPIIGPGRAFTREMLDQLLRNMGGTPQRWILPANVLVCDGLVLCWHVRASRRPIYFNSGDKAFTNALNAKHVLYPHLLFVARPGKLHVFALAGEERPQPSTLLFRAPFFNIYGGGMEGLMCRGNVTLPSTLGPDTLPAWEKTFFETTFTHTNMQGMPLTRFAGGHNALWLAMAQPSGDWYERARSVSVRGAGSAHNDVAGGGRQMKQAVHTIPEKLLTSRVRVALVGCGGNGSQMLTGLARLHTALIARGHPHGLEVTCYDPDKVSEANVGRQLFYPSDIGLHKAIVLTHRVNVAFGLCWEALPMRFDANQGMNRRGFWRTYDLVIGCVDSAASRRSIGETIQVGHTAYWLDLGNSQTTGQVILGEPLSDGTKRMRGQNFRVEMRKGKEKRVNKPVETWLPTVLEVFPELMDASLPEDDTPSCSLADALEKQDLFVNDHVSRWALHLLWTLFRQGKIVHHGYYINLESGRVNPVPVPVAK